MAFLHACGNAFCFVTSWFCYVEGEMNSYRVCATDGPVALHPTPPQLPFFKLKALDLLCPLYENFDCPFAFHNPFSVLLYTSGDGDLNFVLSKEFSELGLFCKLSGVTT